MIVFKIRYTYITEIKIKKMAASVSAMLSVLNYLQIDVCLNGRLNRFRGYRKESLHYNLAIIVETYTGRTKKRNAIR